MGRRINGNGHGNENEVISALLGFPGINTFNWIGVTHEVNV